MSETSKVAASLNNKDDEETSQERVVTVTGTTRACVEFTKALLIKLKENIVCPHHFFFQWCSVTIRHLGTRIVFVQQWSLRVEGQN
jgi:aspartate/methionine/tyrosine aminotransferase